MEKEIKKPMDECNLLIDEDRQLFIVNSRTHEKLRITIFDGSGYYSALWLRTEEEIEKSDILRKENEQKEIARIRKEQETKKSFWNKLFK